MKNKHAQGFSLIELMVVIAVIGILATIAYPNFNDFLRKSRRSDGKSALLDVAQTMERYYTENTSYAGPTLGGSSSIAASVSAEGFYTIAFDSAPTSASVCGAVSDSNTTPSAFRICATPTGAQTADSCGILALSNTGVRTPTTSGCW